VNAQFEQSFSAQRERAQALATILSLDESSAKGAQVLAMIASPTLAPGRTQVERVAETAASMAVDIADAADVEMAEAPAPTAAPARANASPRPTTSASSHATSPARASDTAKAARKAADKARAAAEKLKQTLKELREKQSQAGDHR